MTDIEVSPALRRIGLHAGSETRLLMLEIARELRRRYRSEIHLYCSNAEEVAFYNRQNGDGLLSSITAVSVILPPSPAPADTALIVERARRLEQQTRVMINELAVANRHFGRGYALGGFNHPRSRYSEETDYWQMLHAYNENLDFWDRQIRTKQLTMILNGGKEADVMARAHGIPVRVLAGARYRNFHYWAWDEFHENPQVEHVYLQSGAGNQGVIEAPYFAHTFNRSRFLRRMKLRYVTFDIGLQVTRYAWWRLRGYQKAKGYYLTERVKHIVRRWRDWRYLGGIATARIADLAGQRFVYYPLHTEPEAALQILSPECTYQLAVISAVSRDLPAGVRLAVKETFAAMGSRPRDFYDQIKELKNVIMLAPDELGLDCAKAAAAVATICGTGGFEAAVSGVPVVAFGRHNVYRFLPHVRTVLDWAELKSALTAALDSEFDRKAALLSGSRYLDAVRRTSFDLQKYNYVDVSGFVPESVLDACDKLAEGLRFEQEMSPSAAGTKLRHA